uniref:NADH-ubiquinone oxidoreductase chain 4 n=1 Tax=Cyathocotyle prussica TaxID=2067575 RepID=A0A6J3YVA0_9TREM|nr:NADH dehydrogenase subunit 4 [Cyathocotyle prussica]AYH51385.1 NADH dehydrogenase subunit 4 [Cyathocotyle prussica]
MKFKFIDWYSWGVVYFVVLSLLVLLGAAHVSWYLEFPSMVLSLGSYFMIDSVFYYLSFLSIMLGFIVFFISGCIISRTRIMIGLSVISSVLCYSSSNVLVFWVFYEISILALFYLLIVDSPYSERYIAGWYLLGYVILTSLPMLLSLLFLSTVFGSLSIVDWGHAYGVFDYTGVVLVLGVLFVTKVPVPPFHVWLPIVHAEASSIVSVCLSGYIMKLGLLGVCRLCYYVLPDWLFSGYYVLLAFSLSVLFFVSASQELDGKRWLAFLSLAHILVCVVCFYSVSAGWGNTAFLYSLGHGLSAGLMFLFLWWAYELSGSRNWLVLKSVLGGSRLFRVLAIMSICTAASIPPTPQFFVEVGVLSELGGLNLIVFIIFCLYLFIGSLIPLFLLGGLLTRHFSVEYSCINSMFNFICSILLLVGWSFFMFMLI